VPRLACNAEIYGNAGVTYLRSLVKSTGLSQRECAARIGVSYRMLKYYLKKDTPHPCPYHVQVALEVLEQAENHNKE
jgi:transcriptional regulator with XRE-family HTH domain